ncbi:F-box/FBD/LRR-repeat protein At5g53840-like [Alnus glutinosa]|uniref:F-box/FBD/LRR-repeat protein At5g53840-like n=1 Tax=Alnus glutinosa TaxID=3517 RepID=UPI002D794E63|nr:F-box/FBD/LRR-repeat protein At5g53840-like [Alnus glutinosa]
MGNRKQKRARFVEDRISGMPDDVLVSILSLITMKEAGRTSVLSRRWQKLWTFVPNLNFDGQERLYYLEDHIGARGFRRLHRIARTNYVKWVNRVLELHRTPAIDQFRVFFDLTEDYRRDIDNWINFAMEKRVQRLELSFDYCSLINPYPFPSLYQTRGIPSPNSLRALILKFLNVSGEVLEYFICNCPFLDRLWVEGSETLVNLKVAGPLLRLKHLEISHCLKLENLEISAKNLVSFVYFGPRITMPFKYVPNLVEMSLEGNYFEYSIYNFCEFSSYLPRLETLVLDLSKVEKKMKLLEFHTLSNLKQLELIATEKSGNASLLWLTSLLKAAPVLCRLTLKLHMYGSPGPRKVQKSPKCLHHCLKQVEMVGFVGRTIDVKYVKYLVKNAVELEKVIIDPRCPLMVGTPLVYEEIEGMQAARECAKMLGRELSLVDKLIVL